MFIYSGVVRKKDDKKHQAIGGAVIELKTANGFADIS